MLLLPISLCANAITTTEKVLHMPTAIHTELCETLSEIIYGVKGNNCKNGGYIEYSDAFKLDNDRLLIFFHLNDSKEVELPAANQAFVIDPKNNWKITKAGIMPGTVKNMQRDPKGNLWLYTLTERAGYIPYMLYSKTGNDWKMMVFPQRRIDNSDFDRVINICFEAEQAILTFADTMRNKIRSWSVNYQDIANKKPNWRYIAKDKKAQQCLRNEVTTNNWLIGKKGRTPLLRYNNQPVYIQWPDVVAEKKYYSIRVASFSNAQNAYRLRDRLTEHYRSIFISDAVVAGKHYKHLFIGRFEKQQYAQAKLQQLKAKNPSDALIQAAFVAIP
jgi:hypothetical protein